MSLFFYLTKNLCRSGLTCFVFLVTASTPAKAEVVIDETFGTNPGQRGFYGGTTYSSYSRWLDAGSDGWTLSTGSQAGFTSHYQRDNDRYYEVSFDVDPGASQVVGDWRYFLDTPAGGGRVRYVIPGFGNSTRTPLYASGTTRIDNLQVKAVSAETAAAWSDEVYSTLPGRVNVARYGQPAQELEGTAEKLKNGEKLRVVLLGDSIINDTAWSNWQALVKRHAPDADIDSVVSIRGGTGMEFYQQNGRVQEYVLDQDPDLVILGGISHNRNSDAYRSVIQQIQAGSDAEILVTTGAASSWGDRRGEDNWVFDLRDPELDPDAFGFSFRQALLAVAEQEGVAFLDTMGSWQEYIRQTDPSLPYSTFLRDSIHANHLGQEIIGRTLEAFFAEQVLVVPEPATLALLGGVTLVAGRSRRRVD